jgi:hypothetical protein
MSKHTAPALYDQVDPQGELSRLSHGGTHTDGRKKYALECKRFEDTAELLENECKRYYAKTKQSTLRRLLSPSSKAAEREYQLRHERKRLEMRASKLFQDMQLLYTIEDDLLARAILQRLRYSPYGIHVPYDGGLSEKLSDLPHWRSEEEAKRRVRIFWIRWDDVFKGLKSLKVDIQTAARSNFTPVPFSHRNVQPGRARLTENFNQRWSDIESTSNELLPFIGALPKHLAGKVSREDMTLIVDVGIQVLEWRTGRTDLPMVRSLRKAVVQLVDLAVAGLVTYSPQNEQQKMK